MQEHNSRRFLLISLAWVVAAGSFSCSGKRIAEKVERGADHYSNGRCEEALAEYQEVIEADAAEGLVLFQAYDCLRRIGSDLARMEELRGRAVEALEAVVAGGEAGIADYFYLAALQYDSGDPGAGGQTGFEAIQKFPDADDTALDAVDFYHLGRIYDLMHRQDLAGGIFHKAVERFENWDSPPQAYFTRSLVEAARFDLENREYELAAGKIDRAREIDPLIPIDPLVEGMVMMGARRFEEARTAWYRVQEPADLVLECGVRARLAEKAGRYKSLPRQGPTGRPLPEYSDEEVQAALRERALELNDFRRTFPPGWRSRPDGPARRMSEMERKTMLRGMRKAEREFLALNLEYLLRGHPLHEFASRNGYLNLLRQ